MRKKVEETMILLMFLVVGLTPIAMLKYKQWKSYTKHPKKEVSKIDELPSDRTYVSKDPEHNRMQWRINVIETKIVIAGTCPFLRDSVIKIDSVQTLKYN